MSESLMYPKDEDQVELDVVTLTFAEISAVVDAFYKQVAVDPLLSQPFSSVEDWPHHIERLTHFWWRRFGGEAYMEAHYNPPLKHFQAGFNEVFLTQWLTLFEKTMRSILTPEKADEWIAIAKSMGIALTMKNEFLKKNFIDSKG